jgi:hypothetical protein
MPRLLVVNVCGGLGNRIRVVLSGYAVAQATGRAFAYVWPIDDQFGAKMTDLWEVPHRELPWQVARVIAKLGGGWQSAVDLDDRRPVLAYWSAMIPAEGDPRVAPWGEHLRALRLVPALRDRVDERAAAWDRPMVGVMIRAHGSVHPVTARLSPPEWFYERMAAIRAEHPDVGFFLSTDSPAVAEEVTRRFDGVDQIDGKAEVNSGAALADAVVDLYLLARTDYMLGSHYSSFSDAAALLRPEIGYETAVDPSVRSLVASLRG